MVLLTVMLIAWFVLSIPLAMIAGRTLHDAGVLAENNDVHKRSDLVFAA